MINIEIIRASIDELNRSRSVNFEALPNNHGVFQGSIIVSEYNYTITIDCNNGFPDKFPIFRLVNPNRFFPHIDRDGVICLFDDSSLIIRNDLPSQMMIDAFDRAISILSLNPASEEYKREVAREFSAYWINEARWVLYTNLSPCMENAYKELICVTAGNKTVLSDSKADSIALLHNCFGQNDAEYYETKCILLRLREFSVPTILSKYSWKQLRSFIQKNVTVSQKKAFQRFLDKRVKTLNTFIILIIPSVAGDFYVGFWIYYKGSQYNKIEKLYQCKVEPIATLPIDYSYMLKRGGGWNVGLKDKAVLLIGCGSVGGYVAASLCQCGIKTLDILDKDTLSIDNVHRHILGFNDAIKGKYKSDLMKTYLDDKYPHVEIDSLGFSDRSAEAFIKDTDRLRYYDLIISATGEPMVNLAINKLLYEEKIPIPFITCFNEPYGIGGHAIVTNILGGCLDCLYTDVNSDERVAFRGSFVAPGQDFKKSISGCAGSYVEYSALDSQQTSLLVARLAIEILKGDCKENKIVSWVGEKEDLIKNGYDVSEYYSKAYSMERGIITKNIPKNPRCKICSNQTIST